MFLILGTLPTNVTKRCKQLANSFNPYLITICAIDKVPSVSYV